MLIKKLVFLVMISVLGGGAPAPAEPPASQPATPPESRGPIIVKLTLHPVAIAQPALRFRLLPPISETRPGNAAMQYMMAAQFLPPDPESNSPSDPWNRLDQQLEMTPEAFSPAEADRALALFIPRRWVDMGARRERADWDIDFRAEGINTILPHLNHMRALANVVALRARVAAVRGDFREAEHQMQNDFSMARQLNTQDFLVQDLVSVGIARLILDQGVENWIAQKDAPNLYWALSNLPQRFIDLNAGGSMEEAALRFTDPLFAKALDGKLPPDQWTQLLKAAIRLQRSERDPTASATPAEIEADLKHFRDAHAAEAKQYLRSTGTPQDQINAMSVDQAIGRYFAAQYITMSDELWKAWPLPYAQSAPILIRTEQEVAREKENGNPLLDILSLSLDRARYTMADLDRHIAIARVIEALRDYAAHHAGQPPERLDQITAVPVPNDPVMAKPFEYRADGNSAVIDAPAPQEETSPQGGLHLSPPRGSEYQLTFVK